MTSPLFACVQPQRRIINTHMATDMCCTHSNMLAALQCTQSLNTPLQSQVLKLECIFVDDNVEDA